MSVPPPGYRLAVVALVASTAVLLPGTYYPTHALLWDTDGGSGNSIRVTSVDGKLSEIGPATQNGTIDETKADTAGDTWEDHSHENGTTDEVSNTLELANPNATAEITHVNISISYVQNDSDVEDLIDDSNATAESMNVSVFEYNGTDLVATELEDVNNNSRIDLDDAARSGPTRLDGIGADDAANLTLTLVGDATRNDNIVGGDGIDFTVTIEWAVAPSWRDADRSVNNTIQYA